MNIDVVVLGPGQEISHVETLRENLLNFVCSWRGSTAGYFPMHSHSVIELVYHPRGSGITMLEDGRRIEFEPHGIVIYPEFLRHDQRMSVSGEDICLHIAQGPSLGTGKRLFSEALYIPPGGVETRRPDRHVRSEFLHLAKVRSDPARQLELDLRATALVARLLQFNQSGAEEFPKGSPETYLGRARQYIGENYAKITNVNEIALHVGVSADYLRHLFAGHCGTSLNRLLNQTKIERVKELLIHSRLPLKEIASLSGFETERYLSTRFKKLTGISPGAFRRRSTERAL